MSERLRRHIAEFRSLANIPPRGYTDQITESQIIQKSMQADLSATSYRITKSNRLMDATFTSSIGEETDAYRHPLGEDSLERNSLMGGSLGGSMGGGGSPLGGDPTPDCHKNIFYFTFFTTKKIYFGETLLFWEEGHETITNVEDCLA